jgi:hypothetical protein
MPSVGSPPPAPTPTPTALPIVVTAPTLRLGPIELSRSPSAQYVIPVGTMVVVTLPDELAPFCWSTPTSTAPTVLEPMTHGDELGGGAQATFRAVAPGEATVETTNACYTFPSCGAASELTEAIVTVRA